MAISTDEAERRAEDPSTLSAARSNIAAMLLMCLYPPFSLAARVFSSSPMSRFGVIQERGPSTPSVTSYIISLSLSLYPSPPPTPFPSLDFVPPLDPMDPIQFQLRGEEGSHR